MKLPSTYNRSNYRLAGFSLIEVMVVIGILGVIFAIGFFMSIDALRGFSRRSEHDIVVSVLERARSRAMANIYQTSWGVCYDGANNEYVTFRGATYAAGSPTNELLPVSGHVAIVGLTPCSTGTGIVFNQLTGKLAPQLSPATTEDTISISQNGQTSTITINNEGRING